MHQVFKVNTYNNPELQTYLENALKELNTFFETNWNQKTPKLFVVDDRETINQLSGYETESWAVGWNWGSYIIFILNPKNITTQSSHTEKTLNIEKLIKHELCHIFFEKIFGECSVSWISEGVAVYVAGQVEDNETLEFNGFLDGQKVYQEGGSSIKLLVDHFGKEKLFEFLRKQQSTTNFGEVSDVFKEVYGSVLNYAFFNSLQAYGGVASKRFSP